MANLNTAAQAETIEQQIARLTRENEQLRIEHEEMAKKVAYGNTLRCKVSEKGGVSVYGLQRMPVTLYSGQWARLFRFSADIQKFIRENDKALSHKNGA